MGRRQPFITALLQYLGLEKSWATLCRRVCWLEASQPVCNLDRQRITSEAASAYSREVMILVLA